VGKRLGTGAGHRPSDEYAGADTHGSPPADLDPATTDCCTLEHASATHGYATANGTAASSASATTTANGHSAASAAANGYTAATTDGTATSAANGHAGSAADGTATTTDGTAASAANTAPGDRDYETAEQWRSASYSVAGRTSNHDISRRSPSMIRSFYHHGTDVPATDLKREQLRAALADAGGMLWIDVVGTDADEINSILSGIFDFHTLTIEACLNGTRRPKLENHGDYVFVVVSANDQTPPIEDINTLEVNLYIGGNYVVTHHPTPLAVVDRVMGQAQVPEFLAGLSPDTLVSELVDGVISDYGPALNFLSAAVAGVELEVLTAPRVATVRRMHELRHEVLKLRRVLIPQRDVLNRLAFDELRPVRSTSRVYFRQLSDRCSQMVADTEALTATLDDALLAQQSISSSQTAHLLRSVAAGATFMLPLVVLIALYASGVLEASVGGQRSTSVVGLGVTLLIALTLALYVYRRSW
jgi:magnesium transporter